MTSTAQQSLTVMLREFHTTMHVHDDWLPARPTGLIPLTVTKSRQRLMAEEVRELADALDAGDIVKIADGIADVMYVAAGTAAVTGLLPLLPALLAEVHASNMTKTNVRGQGKLVKGPGYRPPDIAGVLLSGVPAGEIERVREHFGDGGCSPASAVYQLTSLGVPGSLAQQMVREWQEHVRD